MTVFTETLGLIRRERRIYVILNLVYFGLVVVFLILGQLDRTVHDALMKGIGAAYGSGGPLGTVLDAYANGRVIAAVGLTFAINLLVGSFASITLPSLIVPFSGLLVAGFRAAIWGLIFSPEPGVPLTGPNILSGALAAGVLILEGQGYILVMFAALMQGRAFLFPQSVGAAGHWRGYLLGVKQTGKMYLLVAAMLIVAAMYEVFAVAVLPR